jgi:hypothetical protein
MKLEFSRQFSNNTHIKFHETMLGGSRVVPCGQTDVTQLLVAFRNFANVTKNG